MEPPSKRQKTCNLNQRAGISTTNESINWLARMVENKELFHYLDISDMLNMLLICTSLFSVTKTVHAYIINQHTKPGEYSNKTSASILLLQQKIIHCAAQKSMPSLGYVPNNQFEFWNKVYIEILWSYIRASSNTWKFKRNDFLKHFSDVADLTDYEVAVSKIIGMGSSFAPKAGFKALLNDGHLTGTDAEMTVENYLLALHEKCPDKQRHLLQKSSNAGHAPATEMLINLCPVNEETPELWELAVTQGLDEYADKCVALYIKNKQWLDMLKHTDKSVGTTDNHELLRNIVDAVFHIANYDKAYEYCHAIIDRFDEFTDPYIIRSLGLLYYNGRGCDRDFDKSLKYFKWSYALNTSDVVTLLHLCKHYVLGHGCQSSKQWSIYYGKQLVALAPSSNNMHLLICAYDLGGTPDAEEYKIIFKLTCDILALKKNTPNYLQWIVRAYYFGLGCEVNPGKAYEYALYLYTHFPTNKYAIRLLERFTSEGYGCQKNLIDSRRYREILSKLTEPPKP